MFSRFQFSALAAIAALLALAVNADTGEGLYRRTLYTIWKRTAAPPTMTMLDFT